MYYGERCTFVYIVKNIDFKDVKIAKLKLDKIYQYMYINFYHDKLHWANFQHELWKFASRFVNWHLSYYVKLSSDSDISKDCWNWTSTFDNQLTKTYFGSTHKAQELLFSVIIPQVHTFPIVSWVDLWQYQQASYISIWLYVCIG